MAEKLTAGICTSGSRVKLSALSAAKFYSVSKKARNQEKVLFSMFDRLLDGLRSFGPGTAADVSTNTSIDAGKKPKGRRGCGARLTDISTLCVITGPGRFTGLRVGLTLASVLKTLAGIRVYSSTLFEILASQAASSKEFRAWAAGKKDPRIVALVHAFKDEYFCQTFKVTGHRSQVTSLKSQAASFKCKPLDVPRWFKDVEIAVYLAGQGSELFFIADAEEKEDIYSLVPPGHEKAPARLSKILPDFVIKTGLALKNRDLAPLYLKPAKYELNDKSQGASHKSQGRDV